MGPRTPEQRIAKYENRLFYTNSEAIPKVMIDQKALIMAIETAYFTAIYNVEVGVRTILNEEGVPLTSYARYQAFAKAIYHVTLICGGATLSNQAYIIKDRWVAENLTEAILIRILNEVFTIPPPAP